MDIPVTVIGQKMVLDTGQNILAPKSQKFIKFKFDLSDEWNDLTVFAQFTQGGHSYNSYLADDNTVYLPSEITIGPCSMMLYGSGSGNVRGTTHAISLYIIDNRFVEDGESTVISESLYDQILERFDERIQSLYEQFIEHFDTVALVAKPAEIRSYFGF